MKEAIKIFAVAVLVAALTACTNTAGTAGQEEAAQPDSILTPLFAKYFYIEYYKDHKVAVVLNPWDSAKVMARHIITEPLKSVASGSCSYVAFIASLGEPQAIKGVCSPNLIYNPAIRQAVAGGLCSDLGDSFSVNFERVIMLQPQVFFTTAYNQPDQNIQRLSEAGVNIVRIVEWMEPDVLGRAEWIKFIAAFFDKEQTADSLFNSVMTGYDNLIQTAVNAENAPSILPGLPFKGTWYMPAGKSFMAQLFNDAGGSYYFSDNTDRGSLPLSFEAALQNFKECDLWLGLDVESYAALLKTDNRLSAFKPFKERKAYNVNKRKLQSGANDFWESGVVHPEWILSDLVTILHPDAVSEADTTIFIKPLE